MTYSPSSPPGLDVFRIVSDTFGLLFSKFSTIYPLAFVPAALLALLDLAGSGAMPPPDGTMMTAPGFETLVVGFVGMLLSYFVAGFLCLVALDAVIGRTHTVEQYARQAARHILPIAGLGLVVSLLAGFGFVLLILPGFYVIGRFLPWIEAVVFEDTGWRGLGRAQELTEGYRWQLAGAAVLMVIAIVGLGLLAGTAMVAIGTNIVLGLLAQAVISAFYYALFAIFTALVYARLREIKEGVTVEQIAASIG